jgi:hypothetical protein
VDYNLLLSSITARMAKFSKNSYRYLEIAIHYQPK